MILSLLLRWCDACNMHVAGCEHLPERPPGSSL